MSQIRSFIAIELPPPIKVIIGDIQNKLKSSGSDVRWTRPEGIHLTLKFLGNVEEERIPEISNIIERCSMVNTSFMLDVCSLGAFPNERNPKVVWVGIKDDRGNLVKLQKTLEKGLSDIGFKEEKRAFSPHLTLGRVTSSKKKRELAQQLDDYRQCACGRFEAKEVCLLKSELKPGGAVYTKLRTFILPSIER